MKRVVDLFAGTGAFSMYSIIKDIILYLPMILQKNQKIYMNSIIILNHFMIAI